MCECVEGREVRMMCFQTLINAYVWDLEIQYRCSCLQSRNRHRRREQMYGYQVGEGGSGEGIVREFGMDMYTNIHYLKWITNKDLLSSTGNSAQCYVAADGWEGSLEWNAVLCYA